MSSSSRVPPSSFSDLAAQLRRPREPPQEGDDAFDVTAGDPSHSYTKLKARLLTLVPTAQHRSWATALKRFEHAVRSACGRDISQ